VIPRRRLPATTSALAHTEHQLDPRALWPDWQAKATCITHAHTHTKHYNRYHSLEWRKHCLSDLIIKVKTVREKRTLKICIPVTTVQTTEQSQDYWLTWGREYLSRRNNSLRASRSSVRTPLEAMDFIFSMPVQTGPEVHLASSTMADKVPFPRKRQTLSLNHPRQLQPKLVMSTDIH
jgi:hypothetical protein